MKPTVFPQANKFLKAPEDMTNEECGVLPVFSDGEYCISLWKLSFWDKIKIIFIGHIWLWVMSGKTQPPVALEIKVSVFQEKKA